ncbi:MAG: AmmeMemoRadiSam system protein B [Patescibacteria group bacterium]
MALSNRGASGFRVTATSTRSATPPTSINADAFVSASAFGFLKGNTSKPRTVACANIRAGIVNHHGLAADLQTEFFQELRRCKPSARTFIILSPEHFQQAVAPVVTSRRGYLVRGQEVLIEEKAVDRLLQALPFAQEDGEAFTREHGIGAVVPFLSAFFPEEGVRVVPLIIQPRITEEEATTVAAWLRQEMARGAFVIVSSDMSHYLTETTALKNDETTRQALAESQGAFFWRANDDFTDSGKGIWILQNALKSPQWHELSHGISTQYGQSSSYTTSYITGFWE